MGSYRYPTLDELQPTDEELAAQRKAAAAPGQDAAIGGGIGSVLGGAAGALLSIPSFGTLAPALIPAGIGVGSAIGGAAGGAVGNGEAQQAAELLDAAGLERQKKIEALKMRQAALDELERQR